jgi:acetyltransferase-like isoleucine patch superfamily enzyme
VPIDRNHAFGGAGVYSHPKARHREWLKTLGADPILASKLIIAHLINPARFRVGRAWREFERYAQIDQSCWIGPNAWCSAYNSRCESRNISIRAESVIRGILRTEVHGHISIWEHVYIGDDCILNSADHILIKSFSMLAHGVHVFDNDSHPLDWRQRREQSVAYRSGAAASAPKVASAPVNIGEHVWIGMNSFIAKGVTIGDRSIIAASSVVINDVPPDTLAGGNPARLIKNLNR